MQVRKIIIVKGIVQGVGYRYFVRNLAIKYGIKGWVRNKINGDVEIAAECEQEIMEKFINEIRTGHPWARVDEILIEDLKSEGKFNTFDITG